MYEYKAQVLAVYDADTVTLQIDLGCWVQLAKEKCRLFGINAPEMRGPEKAQGKIARDALRDLILGKTVTVKTHKDKAGKYGRLLAEIYIDDINVNQWLVDNGYAVFAQY